MLDINDLLGLMPDEPGVAPEGNTAEETVKAPPVGSKPEQAVAFYIKAGYTPEQATGIVGNLEWESGLDTTKRHDNDTGLGIAGWRGDRLKRLGEYAIARGKAITDFETQLSFVDHELKTTERRAAEALSAAKTPEQAAAAFLHFERPLGYSPTAVQNSHGAKQRMGLATKLARMYAGRPLNEDPQGVAVEATVTTPTPVNAPAPTTVAPPSISDIPPDLAALMPEAVPPETPEFDPKTIDTKEPGFLDNAGAVLSRLGTDFSHLGRGVLEQGARVYDLGAGLAAVPEMAARVFGASDEDIKEDFMTPMLRAGAEQLIKSGQISREQYDKLIPVGEPKELGQKILRATGGAVTPAGSLTVPLTAAIAGGDLLGQAITPAKADIPMPRQVALDLMRDPTAVVNNFGPRVSHTFQTAGGPVSLSDDQFKHLGVVGIATLGAMFAPQILSRVVAKQVPKLRSIKDAPGGAKAMSTLGDLARSYDDINAGVLRLAKRAGIHPALMAKIEDTFTLQTRSHAHFLTNSAVANGRMETPAFQFKVSTPLAKINAAETTAKPLSDYLHMRNIYDEILIREAGMAKRSQAHQASAGPVTIQGMTRQDALNRINAIERANPDVIPVSKEYYKNVKEMRRFEATGEYATLSKKAHAEASQTKPNYVPIRDWDVPAEDMATTLLSSRMQDRLRLRMENEAKGMYIDGLRKTNRDLAVRITPKQMTDNKSWAKNVVTIYRRGKKEHYVTDPFIADVLKMDPYYFGMAGQAANASKKLLEMGSTGVLAPWFAPTSAYRSHKIISHTKPGSQAPWAHQTLMAIPQQLGPMWAKPIAEALERGSGGWLGQMLGPQVVQGLSTRLDNVFQRSLYARLMDAGSYRNSIMEDAFQSAQTKIGKFSQGSGAGWHTFAKGYVDMLQAIHNAPAFAFAKRNEGKMPIGKLAREARHATGDPTVGGQAYVNGRPIRFEDPEAYRADVWLTKMYGQGTELGRASIPWFNPTMQGVKRIGEAYLQNPAAFTGRAWLYTMMPAAAGYLWNRSLGIDPNGLSYSDYQINHRSEYAKTMEAYLALPGRPAEEGIRIPRFHEMSIGARMMENLLDHLLLSAQFNPGEDMKHTAQSYVSSALTPAMPPIGNLLLASQGMGGVSGVFGDESFRTRPDPYDQTGGLPPMLDLAVRAAAGGIGDIIGAGYAGLTQTPDDQGMFAPFGNAAKAMSKRAVIKTPVLRDIVGEHAPASGNTPVNDEMFKKRKAIDQLTQFYRKWEPEEEVAPTPLKMSKDGSRPLSRQPASTKGSPAKPSGFIETKPRSGAGGEIMEGLGIKRLPGELAGIAQPTPTNPLYKRFIQSVDAKFRKDDPKNGGIGFQSLIDRYGDASQHLKSLRKVNVGNAVTWQRQMEQRPEQMKFLKENGIDYRNPIAVRNFYERDRQTVARQILFSIRAVEEEFSRILGRPVKLEDLDPYGQGLEGGDRSLGLEQGYSPPQ